jgi:DNA-directed RNA polymerase II subunit RPB1
MIDLFTILQDFYEDLIQCMFSDDNSDNLVFRIRLKPDNSEDKDYITELTALEKNIMENIVIKGIKNINKSMMNKQETDKYNREIMQFERTYEWVLDTSGTNLVEVMGHPKVDYIRTISNDINEIYDVLGIEAARNALYKELSGVISDADLYVNYRHIALLVDTMTNKGFLLSIDRHGLNRGDIGPLAKCSFEETTDMIIKAGIFSEVDKITGVAANIMLGQIPPCGTGETEVLLDEFKLLNNMAMETIPEEVQADVEDACNVDSLTFDFRAPSKNDKDDINEISAIDIKLV